MKNQALGHLQWDLSFTSAPAQHFYRRIKIPLLSPHKNSIISRKSHYFLIFLLLEKCHNKTSTIARKH